MDLSEKKDIILVLTDFSNCSRQAADYALTLARKFNAGILLFHSYYVPASSYETWAADTWPSLASRSIERLEAEAARLNTQLEESGATYRPIIDRKCDVGTIADNVRSLTESSQEVIMVVMGGYRAKNNDDFFSGTAIKEVLGHAKCPAVIVPEVAE